MTVRRPALALAAVLAGCPRPGSGPGLEAQLEREVIALHEKVRMLEEQVETCGEDGTPDAMYSELHQVFVGSDIVVERKGLTTVVTVPGDHLFTRGTDMRDEGKITLDFLSTALSLHPTYALLIEGHTDDAALQGDLRKLYGSDWGLSYARAEAVMDLMVSDFKVAESRFALVARGPFQPLASNDTEGGRARNRRIVFYFKPPGASPY